MARPNARWTRSSGARSAGRAGLGRSARIDVRAIRFDLVTVVFTDPPRIEHQTDAWALSGGRV